MYQLGKKSWINAGKISTIKIQKICNTKKFLTKLGYMANLFNLWH